MTTPNLANRYTIEEAMSEYSRVIEAPQAPTAVTAATALA